MRRHAVVASSTLRGTYCFPIKSTTAWVKRSSSWKHDANATISCSLNLICSKYGVWSRSRNCESRSQNTLETLKGQAFFLACHHVLGSRKVLAKRWTKTGSRPVSASPSYLYQVPSSFQLFPDFRLCTATRNGGRILVACGKHFIKTLHSLTTDWTTEVRSPSGAKNFSSSLCVQTSSETHPVTYPMGTGGKERLGRWRWPLTPI
jgi:hypothetical protein